MLIKNNKHIAYFICQIFVAIMVFVFPSHLLMAQAKLTASASSTSVGLNSSFQITYSLSGGTGESFSPPSFSNFSLRGTSRSSGGGMTVIVNGKVVQNGGGEEKWIYTLVPTAIGKFTISAAKVKVGGQWISSNSLSIDVIKGSSNQNQGQTNNQKSGESSGGSSSDLFLKAYVDKTNPVQGEQITVTYKIYTRIPVTQYAINKLSSFSGFWTHDLIKDKTNPKQYTETVNGSKYTVAEIRKVALFAQKSGQLIIDPLEVECLAQVEVKQNSGFDQFFNDPFFNNPFFQNSFKSLQNVKRTIKSNAISVNVSSLPSTDKPAEFSGAVGNFTFSGEIDKTEIKQNEPISLNFTINGTGNINLIDKPAVTFPTDFEVYDPQINDNISVNGEKVSGSRTYEYLIIPRNAGNFEIKPVTFSYYNLSLRKYVSSSTPSFRIKVAKGEGGGSAVYGGSGKEDVKYIGSDVRYINLNINPLHRIGWTFFNSPLYYIAFSLPFLLFLAFVLIWRRRLKLHSNTALLKNIRATGIANKRLKIAGKYLQEGNSDLFYIELSKALWGYIGDKFNIALSYLSLETVKENLSVKAIDSEILERLIETLNLCEYARFAPADPSVNMEKMYGDATKLITDIEANLKQ